LARKPAPFSETPLQALTRPIAKPPASKPAPYRPKIDKPRRRPAPRRTPPRAPARAFGRTPLQTLTRPVPQKGSPALQHAAHQYRQTLENQARAAQKQSASRGDFIGHFLPIGGHRLGAKVPPDLGARGHEHYDPSTRTSDQLMADVAYFHLSPAAQSHVTGRYFDKHVSHNTKVQSAVTPYVEKALDVATRPVNAVAGAASVAAKHPLATVTGTNLPELAQGAVKSGLGHGNQRKLFSDVLKEHGVKGPAASLLGFALDVGLDPTTYLTFGGTSVAREAALRAARDAAASAEKAALKSGAAKAIAKERGRAAGRAALKHAAGKTTAPGRHLTSGLDVRVAGKRVPGVTRATGAVHHAASSATGRALAHAPERVTKTLSKAGSATKNVGAELNANVRAAGVTRSTQYTTKALQREARAEAEKVTRRAAERVNALHGRIGKDEHQQIIDAIESGDLKSLKGAAPIKRFRGRNPDRLYQAARMIQDDLKHLHRVGRRSGAITGTVGDSARTRLEGMLAQPEAGVRTSRLASLPVEFQHATQQLVQARADVRTAATKTERLAAQRRVREWTDRRENLRRRGAAGQQQLADVQTARAAQKASRTNRRQTQARGYFPRVTQAETEHGGVLDRLAAPLHSDRPPTVHEQIGSNRPEIRAGQTREYRKSRAQLAADPDTEHVVRNLSTDVRQTVSQYAGSVARASAARNLNLKMLQQLGRKLPHDVSRQQLRDLTRTGYSVYRVRGGQLERMDPEKSYATINAASKGQAGANRVTRTDVVRQVADPLDPTRTLRLPQTVTSVERRGLSSGGQYRVLKDETVAQVRNRLPGSSGRAVALIDKPTNLFKSVALTTPAYLVRNLVGDNYNAWGDERFWRLARNQLRGQKALGALGRYERAMRKFGRELPADRRTVKLTDEQAAQIGRALGLKPEEISRKMPAMAVALLAEKMGVIRQGRFLELMEEGRSLTKSARLARLAGRRQARGGLHAHRHLPGRAASRPRPARGGAARVVHPLRLRRSDEASRRASCAATCRSTRSRPATSRCRPRTCSAPGQDRHRSRTPARRAARRPGCPPTSPRA
jgi:hypothetical protein